ncbi:MAG: GH3 auxin-responsive promoter family protein, partial [Ruminiclostridium sp.]
MGLKDKIRDNLKMVAFKTYLETVYNKDFEELREASINPRKSAEQGLRNILTYAKDTSYGIEHHFSYILEAEDDTELYKRYESEVSVNTYNDFEKYIDISKHGAENVLIP